MNLTTMIKKIQIEFAANIWLGGPSEEIQEVMKNEGWNFTMQYYYSRPNIRGGGGHCAINYVTSPEGKNVFEDTHTAKLYRDTRYKIASKIYGLCL